MKELRELTAQRLATRALRRRDEARKKREEKETERQKQEVEEVLKVEQETERKRKMKAMRREAALRRAKWQENAEKVGLSRLAWCSPVPPPPSISAPKLLKGSQITRHMPTLTSSVETCDM